MSPKVEVPPEGQAVKQTTVTEVISSKKANSAAGISSDSIEYMEKLTPQEWADGNHVVYVYRDDPPTHKNATGSAYVTKFSTPISLDEIQKQYGGGLWRIVVKRGSERMTDRSYSITGMPMDLTRVTMQEFRPDLPGGVPPAATSTEASIANRAMDLLANPSLASAQTQLMLTGANAAIQMVAAAAPKQLSTAEILQLTRELQPAQGKSFWDGPLGPLLISGLTVLLERVLKPVDPLTQISQMADIMAKFGGGSSTNDWKTAMVQAAPQLASAVTQGLHEMRLGAEAQMRLNAGRTLPAAPAPAPVPAQNPIAPAPAPAENKVLEMPQSQLAEGGTPLDEFEKKLVELLNTPGVTGAAAGEELEKHWPQIVDEVSQYGVDQIMMAFAARPNLQAHKDNPRLRPFLQEFLDWVNEAPPKPAA